MSKYVVCITGSRTFTDRVPIREALQELIDKYGAGNIILRHGSAKGADTLAKFIARNLGIKEIQDRPVEYYGYSWDDGKDAGNKRNIAMLEEDPKPKLVLAFPDDNSRGTWNMIEFADDRGIETKVYLGALSHNNPHLSTLKQVSEDIKGITIQDKEVEKLSAAMLVANDLYPGASINYLHKDSKFHYAITKERELKALFVIGKQDVEVDTYRTVQIPSGHITQALSISAALYIPVHMIVLYKDALVSFHLAAEPDTYNDSGDRGNYDVIRFTYHLRKEVNKGL